MFAVGGRGGGRFFLPGGGGREPLPGGGGGAEGVAPGGGGGAGPAEACLPNPPNFPRVDMRFTWSEGTFGTAGGFFGVDFFFFSHGLAGRSPCARSVDV